MKLFREWRTLPYESLPQWKTPRVCVITGSAEETHEVVIQAEGKPGSDGSKPTYELTVTLANKIAMLTKACLGLLVVSVGLALLSIVTGSIGAGIFFLLIGGAAGAGWYVTQPQLIAAEDGLRVSCFAAGAWALEESIDRAVTGRNPLIADSGAPRFFVTKKTNEGPAASTASAKTTAAMLHAEAEPSVFASADAMSFAAANLQAAMSHVGSDQSSVPLAEQTQVPTTRGPLASVAPTSIFSTPAAPAAAPVSAAASVNLRPAVVANRFLPRVKAGRDRKGPANVVDLTDPYGQSAASVEDVPSRIDRMAVMTPNVAATQASIKAGTATPDALATLSLDEQLAVFEGTHPKQLVEWAQKSQALFPIHAQCAAAHAWMEKALLAGNQNQPGWAESMSVANRCLQSAAMIDPHDALLVRLQVIEAFMMGLDATSILTRVRACVPHAVTPLFTTEMAVRLGPLQGGSVGLALTALTELTVGLAADHPARVGFLVLQLEAIEAGVDAQKVDSINAANVFLAARMKPLTPEHQAFIEFAAELATRTGRPAPTVNLARPTHSSEARSHRFGRRHTRVASSS